MSWPWGRKRRREEEELDEELRFHLQQETHLLRDRGAADDEAARRRAQRDFGNAAQYREATRDIWGFGACERAMQDLRYAGRGLAKNLSFTFLCLVALALGIGATTATFTVVHSVLLRPLSFPEPDHLVTIWERAAHSQHDNVVQTQNFLVWRKRNRSFEDIAAFVPRPTNLEHDGEAVQVPGMRVTAAFFPVLGVAPELGRTFAPADDVPGAPVTAVIGYGLWQSRFGGRRDVVGSKIRVSDTWGEVIGVMPESFAFPTAPDVNIFLPLQIDTSSAGEDGRNYSTVARLRRGVSLQQADAEMRAIAAQTAAERPAMNFGWSAAVVPLKEKTVNNSREVLLILMAAVGFVLLIACANVANLQLIRATARRREMTIRTALGAGRWRLIHLLLVESLVLAVLGGAAGLVLASWGIPAFLQSLPSGFPLPRMSEVSVDGAVATFAFAVSALCGVVFGIIPAIQVSREHMGETLRQGGRGVSAGGGGARRTLVVVEIAVAMLLVIGAGLTMRSFLRLAGVNPGFRADRLLTVRMNLVAHGNTPQTYLTSCANAAARILEHVRSLPEVKSASSIHLLPMTGMQSGSGAYRLDRPVPAPGATPTWEVSVISDAYFATMGIPIIAGREFTAADRAGSPLVVVINQAAAKQHFAGENPLGKRLHVSWSHLGEQPNDAEVVGVAADIRHDGLDIPPGPCIFLPQSQQPSGSMALLVRTQTDPASAIAALRRAIREAAPSQGIRTISTMDEVVSDYVARPRLEMAILAVFGALALLLACVGIYAVISCSVEQRTREMGIRLALGAARGTILLAVLREGLLLVGIGLAAGTAASLLLTRYLKSLLFEVKSTDPAVYAVVALVLAATAAAGCWFPARRATGVDPVIVLREE